MSEAQDLTHKTTDINVILISSMTCKPPEYHAMINWILILMFLLLGWQDWYQNRVLINADITYISLSVKQNLRIPEPYKVFYIL